MGDVHSFAVFSPPTAALYSKEPSRVGTFLCPRNPIIAPRFLVGKTASLYALRVHSACFMNSKGFIFLIVSDWQFSDYFLPIAAPIPFLIEQAQNHQV